MSKQIDISDPKSLSDEDREYLMARGRVNVVQHLEYIASLDVIPVASQVEDVEPYEKWEYRDLQAECKERGLPADGKAEDLANRLNEHDELAGE